MESFCAVVRFGFLVAQIWVLCGFCFLRNSYCGRLALVFVGLVSWCVAFGSHIRDLRKLRPRVELQHSSRVQGESLGNRTETGTSARAGDDDALTKALRMLGWKR